MTGGERRVSGSGGDSGSRRDRRLEARYERLLRWYPAGHQARHGREMLGVLLAAAGPGQERPRLRESANLIGGALRIRLRAATTGSAGQWRDALARAAVLLPLALLVTRLSDGALMLAQARGHQMPLGKAAILLGNAVYNGPLLGLVIAMLAGRRRIALAATAVVAAQVIGRLIAFGGLPPYMEPRSALTLSVMGILAAGLVLVQAPPGWVLLTRRHCALTVLAATGLGAVSVLVGRVLPVTDAAVVVALIAVIAILMLAGSPGSRRLLAIALAPLYFTAISTMAMPAYMSAISPLGLGRSLILGDTLGPGRNLSGVPVHMAPANTYDIIVTWLPLGAALLAGAGLTALLLVRRARGRIAAGGVPG